MTDPLFVSATIATTVLAAVIVVALAGLKAWREWLALQRLSLEGRDPGPQPSPAAARIELADLRERVRKLEAIAAGVDL